MTKEMAGNNYAVNIHYIYPRWDRTQNAQ